MKKKFTGILLVLAWSLFSNAQESIHQEQLNYYNSTGNTQAAFYELGHTVSSPEMEKVDCNLNKIVYGWHPYWVGNAYQNYQWDLLSHFSFFSYEVNAADGEPLTTHGWSTSTAVDEALASGNTKVTLCVTLFSGHTTFFGSSTAQQTLIDNLINLVSTRGAHGVNIDFEGLPASQTTNFTNFMVSLSDQMHAAIPNSEVSTVLYAVDWNSVFDFSIMEPAVDHYIIMGYAYYYSGSTNAGPTDPLYHFGSTYNYTLSRSITYYLDIGCPKDKLVLGLPSYGYEWATASASIPSATTGSGTAKTFAVIMNNSSGNYSQSNQVWEQDSYSDVFVFNDGTQKQSFISLDSAWRKRLEHVNHTGIAGIGIWALGYDNGYNELWNAMSDYLTDCHSDPCSGNVHDFGGPTKNYYNDEDYTWTLSPENATSIDFDFYEFDVESNYDYLYIYDGNSILAAQIAGSPFTGLNGPGNFSSSTGDVTFRFVSDGATVAPGFNATYVCVSQDPPLANFDLPYLDVCQGDSVQLLNLSVDGETYDWTTSTGGLSSTSASEPYLFPSSSGNYTITLIVSNGVGADTIDESYNLIIHQDPIADFQVNSTNFVLPNATAFFTNSSQNGTEYQWHFGDLESSMDENPWHDYTSNGTYDVMLIVSNEGCENDTATVIINVGVESINLIDLEGLKIYPNPVTNHLAVKFDRDHSCKGEIIDSHGKMVKEISTIITSKLEIDTESLASGVYSLILNIDGVQRQARFTK